MKEDNLALKSRKRSEIAEQTTEYYTSFNEQHSDTTCRQVVYFNIPKW